MKLSKNLQAVFHAHQTIFHVIQQRRLTLCANKAVVVGSRDKTERSRT